MPDDLTTMIVGAERRGARALRAQPRAHAVRYDRKTGRVYRTPVDAFRSGNSLAVGPTSGNTSTPYTDPTTFTTTGTWTTASKTVTAWEKSSQKRRMEQSPC